METAYEFLTAVSIYLLEFSLLKKVWRSYLPEEFCLLIHFARIVEEKIGDKTPREGNSMFIWMAC